ncbi:methyl-CpG-binding domain protein 1-like isoform X4 [Hyperolius riggenbachi]|uniref:methyl-CpG-binding domain protein 1-like isoform X4 n=1 Tax=Hyperolius riggenbachi TaxID=752182 RepID=UPI0035A3BAA1
MLPADPAHRIGEIRRRRRTMSEGWEDWPLLGPGWKRRTAVRKSGQSFGHSDTYYQSPTGQRFRSKPELSKFLGASVDLACFNFKQGTIIPVEQRLNKTKKKKKSPSSAPSSPVPGQHPKLNDLGLTFTVLSPEQQKQNGTNGNSVYRCCDGCKQYFPGVELGRSKQTVFYCADCRASRRKFNREQKLLKTTGCGICSGCTLTEDCGYCSICQFHLHNPDYGKSWKCMKRRCGKRIAKPDDCGVCVGCTATEDCQTCTVCLKRQESPDLDITRSCLKRRCFKKKPGTKSKVKNTFAPKKKWKLMSEQDGTCVPSKPKKWKQTYEQHGSSLPAKKKWKQKAEQDGSLVPVKKKKKSYYHKVKGKREKRRQQRKVGHRRNRKCGECEACQRKVDCGDCDYCQDKPKFGGRNLKRQKCRWRQCLRFAAEKNIPVNLKGSSHPVILERLQREKSAGGEERKETPQKPVLPLMPRLPIIKLERLDHRNGGYTSSNDSHGGWVIGKVKPKEVKQEVPEPVIEAQPIQEQPLDLHCLVKEEEFIVETNDVLAADESTPVITQIFSLSSLTANNGLNNVLLEFLTELNEIPLPAHWEVLSDVGPTLQLVQRSKSSTMADTVIHIQPGLHFHIVVKDYTVPSLHELYRKHPSRLTTVDEVVELICDLEAYRPCSGLPRGGLRSPNCQVLVYEERCPACIQNPWPSGMVF